MDDRQRKNRREQRKVLKNILLVSTSFLLNLTGFQGLSRLQSSLHHDAGMGVINQGILYLVLILSCLLLPKIMMARIGHKWAIALSTIGYIIWMAANGYAVWATMVPASIIVGLSAGPLWAAQGSYFTLLAPHYAALTGSTEEATVTKFFGIFFAFVQASGVTGSIISSTILQSPPVNGSMGSEGLVLETCGAKACPYHNTSNPNLDQPAKHVVWTLLGVYIAVGVLAVLVVAFFVDKLPEDLRVKEASSCKETTDLLLATVRLYQHKETLLLFFITMYSGMEVAFFMAEFSQSFISCSVGIGMVGYVTLPFGIVNTFISFGSARLARYTGQMPLLISAFVVDLCLHFTMMFWMPNPEQIWVLYLISAFWGYTDGIWQPHINALYGLVFPNDTEAAFSGRLASNSLGFVLVFSSSHFLCTSTKLYILTTVLVLGISGYLAVEIPRRKNIRSYSTDHKQNIKSLELNDYKSSTMEGQFNLAYM